MVATPWHAVRPRIRVLLVRAGGRVCALRVDAVIETMRPLPVSPLADVPRFVAGVAVVRGEPVPVIALGAFLGDVEAAPPSRFVTVRAGATTAALAVDAVEGLAPLRADDAARLPAVADACAGAIEALGARDADLVVVLRAARLVPDEVRRALLGARGGEA
jgi:purine-binding chemotaxis protein CheW